MSPDRESGCMVVIPVVALLTGILIGSRHKDAFPRTHPTQKKDYVLTPVNVVTVKDKKPVEEKKP